jgi:hypothetical protein
MLDKVIASSDSFMGPSDSDHSSGNLSGRNDATTPTLL